MVNYYKSLNYKSLDELYNYKPGKTKKSLGQIVLDYNNERYKRLKDLGF